MKTIKIFCMTLACAIWFNACQKPYDEDKKIGPPLYSADQLTNIITGRWVMKSAKQVDEKSLTMESIDISDFFVEEPGSQFPNISFSSAKTFTVDTAGLATNYFKVVSGNWAFDNDQYPTAIILTESGGVAIGNIVIGSNLLGFTPRLNYKQSANCGGAKAFTYDLEFVKN